jgi:hypothetical protein
MTNTLATERRHESSIHPQHRPASEQAVRRVGLVDRAALHLGVALIKWGRRPGLAADERRANRLERALAARDRDLRIAAERDNAALNYGMLTLVR